MTNGQSRGPGPQVNTGPLVAGAVLIGAGTVLGLAGLALSGTALAVAARRWVNEMDVPPRELVRQQVAKAKAAGTAGASAWRDGSPASRRRRA